MSYIWEGCLFPVALLNPWLMPYYHWNLPHWPYSYLAMRSRMKSALLFTRDPSCVISAVFDWHLRLLGVAEGTNVSLFLLKLRVCRWPKKQLSSCCLTFIPSLPLWPSLTGTTNLNTLSNTFCFQSLYCFFYLHYLPSLLHVSNGKRSTRFPTPMHTYTLLHKELHNQGQSPNSTPRFEMGWEGCFSAHTCRLKVKSRTSYKSYTSPCGFFYARRAYSPANISRQVGKLKTIMWNKICNPPKNGFDEKGKI